MKRAALSLLALIALTSAGAQASSGFACKVGGLVVGAEANPLHKTNYKIVIKHATVTEGPVEMIGTPCPDIGVGQKEELLLDYDLETGRVAAFKYSTRNTTTPTSATTQGAWTLWSEGK